MLKRDVTLTLMALGCGVLAFVLVLNFLKASAQQKSHYVIAVRSLSEGTIINSNDIILSKKPIKNINRRDVFLQLEDVIGGTVIKKVRNGEIIRRFNVKRKTLIVQRAADEPPEETAVSLPIPKGMRAFTVSSREINNVPDLLNVGNYVDLLGNVPNYEGLIEMRTILRGAQVLSIHLKDNTDIRSITLSLTPVETEVVMKAIGRGKIRIIVRPDIVGEKVDRAVWESAEIIRGVDKQKKYRFTLSSPKEKSLKEPASNHTYETEP